MDKDLYSTKEYFNTLNKYFRAVNYLSATQLYLLDNPLLEEKLTQEHIKKKIVGHWGTVPGQNFIYTHCNRVITKYDLNMILLSGPGHGGNFYVANSYLEGTYSEYYPNITLDKEGMTRLCKQFSFPKGVGSHATPEVPGSINEGGELGYSLAHGFGAVLDNPNLIATVIVGDGEAETGPLATSWHSNKFLNPVSDGAVLPVLHLNGYKISNPTVLSRIPKKELESLLRGYGYKPYFVEGSKPEKMHKDMAKAMDKCIESIKNIWFKARKMGNTNRPVWPMIVLRTPKGWTGPKSVDGLQIENSFRAHQVPIAMNKDNHLKLLENWLKSYKPEELFENYKLKDEIASILPKGNARISANPNGNGGMLLKEIRVPNFEDYAVKFDGHGSLKAQDMLELGGYIRDVFALNDANKNFRVFSPDEAMSNRLYRMFEVQNRDFNAKIIPSDDKLAKNGRIMDSYLSEHMCEGWLEGYLLTGRHGIFHSYEAFIRVVDSMIGQHAKWLKMCSEIKWRQDIASLNLLVTSNAWQQDHNGYTHQDPGILNQLNTKKPEFVRTYLPADANCLLSCMDHCLKSKNYINLVVASKHPSWQWLSMKEAKEHCSKGVGIWDWACNGDKSKPDIVIACAGDTPTLEALACSKILRTYIPNLNIRFVNVVDLYKLVNNTRHPHGLTDEEYDNIFTTDKPIIFNFHGYASLIHELTYDRKNTNLHVRGYNEEGSITTAFDMRVQNKIDRYNLTLLACKYLNIDKTLKEKITSDMENLLEKHNKYIAEYGVDMPEVSEWNWND